MPELRTLPELASLQPRSAMAVRQGKVALTHAHLSGLAAGLDRDSIGVTDKLGSSGFRSESRSSLPVH
jgi:hypothetical protein